MDETIDLKETILQVASELFAKHGFAGTSIKQIGEAAGCTTAALYYHFEDGKVHILREVARSYSKDVLSAVDEEGEFDDLGTYLECLTERIGRTMPKMIKRLNWLVFELHHLPAEERDPFTGHFLGLHRAIRAGLEQYLQDDERANMLAWMIVCAFLGYGQLFQVMSLEASSAPSLEEFGRALMAMVGQAEGVI